MPATKILIVEDEGIVSIDIRNILKQIGYPTTEAVFSAEEAFEKMKENQPDLVLMDIGLKGKIDGIEAAKIIKERYNIPVVFLTGYADENTIERAKSVEPVGYIIKPIDDNELKKIIAEALT
ncbi:MAG: response regulator [Candidatus Bathyarchaeia archaeon]